MGAVMASEPTPEQSYCATEARRNDWERFMCALFAPSEARASLFSLIAFNSELARTRDVVSQPLLGQIRLQWWRDAIAAIYGEAPPSAATATHPILVPLARTIATYRLDRALFDAMIDARSDELDEGGLVGAVDVLDYLLASCGNLARLQIAVIANGAAPSTDSIVAAEHANVAWGLIELVRMRRLAADDIGEARSHIDAARKLASNVEKRYLPVLLPATLATCHLAHPNAGRVRRQLALALNAFRGKF
jgi:NADH dehydrogenase [ubiquinone] 1 alpha subcomplex assembly factor 6